MRECELSDGFLEELSTGREVDECGSAGGGVEVEDFEVEHGEVSRRRGYGSSSDMF